MACESCGDKPKKCNKDFARTVVEIDNPEQITLMRRVVIPTSMGDDTTVPPVVGKYKNVLLFYEANSKSYLYSSDGIPTLLANGLTDYEQAVNLPQINGVTLTGNRTSSQLGLQPTLSVAPGTGIKLEDNELSGLPATDTTIGMVKPGDGLEVGTNGTMSVSDVEQYAHFFDTVAAMKAATNLVAGDYAKTLGYYTKKDGGGALYKIENSPSTSYHMEIGNNLYAVLISSNINVDQLGANGGNLPLSHFFDTLEEAQKVYPNATALTELIGGVAIQCAIDYFYNKDIYFGNRVYYTNTQLNVTDTKRIHFIGTNFGKSIIKRMDEGTSENNNIILSLSRITSSPTKNVIENIDFIGPHSGNDTSEATLNTYYTIGVDMNYSSYNVFRNCAFMYLKSGVHAHYSWTNVFDNCFFDRNNSGIDTYSASEFNDIEINHCYFVHNNRGLYLGQGRSQLVVNCDIENNNIIGLQRTNSGDIQIINTYFEDKIFIPVAQTAVQNILITGCSFYQNSTNNAFYTPIRYDGEADVTQVTIMNCNFIDGNSSATATNSAISEYSGNDMRPVLMNNTTIHMREYNPSGMRGIHIKNGLIHNYLERSFSVNFINGTSGGESSLSLNNAVYYRLNVPVSGTHSIKLPTVPATNEYFDTRFQFIVGSNNDSGRAGDVSIIPDDSSTCEVTGYTTITYADKNKIIEAVYEGGWSSKSHWSVTVSA